MNKLGEDFKLFSAKTCTFGNRGTKFQTIVSNFQKLTSKSLELRSHTAVLFCVPSSANIDKDSETWRTGTHPLCDQCLCTWRRKVETRIPGIWRKPQESRSMSSRTSESNFLLATKFPRNFFNLRLTGTVQRQTPGKVIKLLRKYWQKSSHTDMKHRFRVPGSNWDRPECCHRSQSDRSPKALVW